MTALPDNIPVVNPIAIGQAKTSGRTKPVELRCVHPNGQYQNYIVKLWANPEVHLQQHSLARELYASLLATILDIPTPAPSLVEISFQFSQALPPLAEYENLRQSIGLNFGSLYLQGLPIFSPPVILSKHSQAVKIFCFDMFTGNPDRRMEKPNVFDAPDGFVIFDHEQAFPFSRPQMILGGYPPACEYILEKWHKDHIFYKSIKNRGCALEIEEFVTSVGCLSDEIFDTIESLMPAEWHTGKDLQNIRHYLADALDNIGRFKRSLQEILA